MNILITGSSGGLGACLATELRCQGHRLFGYDRNRNPRHDVRRPDLTELKHDLDAHSAQLDCLINCAGINKINWLEDVQPEEWDEVMDINAKGVYMMTRACLPLLKRGTHPVVINIVSNAAHVPMTCSLAYNASKGAAHIMTLQLARELTKRYGICVFGIAPNKLRGTGMSQDIDEQVVKTRGWSPKEAHEYQLKSLLVGEETPPTAVADFIAFLLSQPSRYRYLSGTVIPYGA